MKPLLKGKKKEKHLRKVKLETKKRLGNETNNNNNNANRKQIELAELITWLKQLKSLALPPSVIFFGGFYWLQIDTISLKHVVSIHMPRVPDIKFKETPNFFVTLLTLKETNGHTVISFTDGPSSNVKL